MDLIHSLKMDDIWGKQALKNSSPLPSDSKRGNRSLNAKSSQNIKQSEKGFTLRTRIVANRSKKDLDSTLNN